MRLPARPQDLREPGLKTFSPASAGGSGRGIRIADGKALEDVVTVEDCGGVGTVIEVGDEVSNWVTARFSKQVRVRYAELAQGKPHGKILGGP